MTLPTLTTIKASAKRLRQEAATRGDAMSHAEALEHLAHEHGHKDWNTFKAAIDRAEPEAWPTGAQVTGRYLSQGFRATVARSEEVRPGWTRLWLELDEAVDVVTFDSFSNMRKRITGVVGPAGTSAERTSDGTPHLILDL